jgi:hypothetical protein
MSDLDLPKTIEEKEKETKELELRKQYEEEEKKAKEAQEQENVVSKEEQKVNYIEEEPVKEDIPLEEKKEEEKEYEHQDIQRSKVVSMENIVTEETTEIDVKKIKDAFERKSGFSSFDLPEDGSKPVGNAVEIEKHDSKLLDSIATQEEDGTRLLSRRSSVIFICVCVAVVFFCVGGIVGFYFGSNNSRNTDQQKKVINVSTPPSQRVENNVAFDQVKEDEEVKEGE